MHETCPSDVGDILCFSLPGSTSRLVLLKDKWTVLVYLPLSNQHSPNVERLAVTVLKGQAQTRGEAGENLSNIASVPRLWSS